MVNALLALLLCQLAGEALVRVTDAPVPGPVLGLVILLGGLSLLRLARGPGVESVPEPLEKVSAGLLSHLSLLFVPAGVGVMVHAQRIKADWAPLTVALIGSTLLTIAVTAVVFKLVDRALSRRRP
ncbi:MAG: CidA/LrgA family protein [Rhodospirillaceae bacterium]